MTTELLAYRSHRNEKPCPFGLVDIIEANQLGIKTEHEGTFCLGTYKELTTTRRPPWSKIRKFWFVVHRELGSPGR
jgi:hypothetical protein